MTSSDPGSNAAARKQRSIDAVLAETYRLLSTEGIAGVSVDEISRRSGVAKTTIYRHWPSRSALLLDACSKMSTTVQAPDSGDFWADIEALAVALATQLSSARWATVLPSIVDAAERDDEVARLHAGLHRDRMAPFISVIERAQQRGLLDGRMNAADLTALIVGPLFYRRWFSKEPLDARFVQIVLEALAAHPPSTRRH